MKFSAPEQAAQETALLKRLGEIERAINDLEGERDALRRLIVKVRRENLWQRDVTRKNSVNRILVESEILEYVASFRTKAIGSQSILTHLHKTHTTLKDATFRSYLHRLHARGLIRPRSRGHWVHRDFANVAETASPPTPL